MTSLNAFKDILQGIYEIIQKMERNLKEIFEILKDNEGYDWGNLWNP